MVLKLEREGIMAGFTLGGGGGGNGASSEHHHHQSLQGATQQSLQSESLFQLYSGSNNRSQDITYSTTPPTTRGFELWQQHQQQIQRQQQEHHNLYPTSVGSLLAFTSEPVLQIGGAAGRSVELSMRGHSSGSMSCQDCGNQAKKDCVHLRCRTCCKSRGLHCSTHVKSTWVPAAKRRERQQQLAAAASLQQQRALKIETQQPPMASARIGGDASKGSREIMSIVAATTASSGAGAMESGGRFPTEVSSPATFRCVRVSPIDDVDEEFAYQTSVSIGGHVFKGILYDHGPDSQYPSPTTGHHAGEFLSSANASAGAIAAPNEVSIATALAVNPAVPTSSTTVVATGTSAVADPNSLYPAPLGAFMVGTQFFPHNARPN